MVVKYAATYGSPSSQFTPNHLANQGFLLLLLLREISNVLQK